MHCDIVLNCGARIVTIIQIIIILIISVLMHHHRIAKHCSRQHIANSFRTPRITFFTSRRGVFDVYSHVPHTL
jgi:hypothetical protein